MKKPRIKIELDQIDKRIQGLGIIAIIILIALPIFYYIQLPDLIPSHFNASGNPDGYNAKWSIWILPLVGSILYLILFRATKFPHRFNYPVKVTAENAPELYKISTRMIRILNTVIACGFSYITYCIIQTAKGNQNGLGNFFVFIFLALMIFPTLLSFQNDKNRK